MNESALWQECWTRLDATFASTAERLRECNPEIWFQSGWRTTDRWPFDAWAEFSRVNNSTRTEDIVVFFRIKRADNSYIATVDISTGEGFVLADGPTWTSTIGPSGVWESEMLALAADVKRFLEDHLGLLREALC